MLADSVCRSATRALLAALACSAAALAVGQPAAPAAAGASAPPPPLISQMASARTFQPRSNDELAMLIGLKIELLARMADPAEQVDAARARQHGAGERPDGRIIDGHSQGGNDEFFGVVKHPSQFSEDEFARTNVGDEQEIERPAIALRGNGRRRLGAN